jgi:Xaa-Pro dipeptidase
MPSSKVLPFSVDEFQTRLATVRAEMKKRELEVLVLFNPENIYYLTGYASLSYFVYQSLLVTHHEPPCMIGRLLVEKTYRKSTWSEAIRPYKDTDDPIQVTAAAVKDVKVGQGRIGIEESSGYLNVQQHRKLVSLLPGAQLVDGSGVVERPRLIKSPAEIAYIREAARLADIGIEAAVGAIREGVSEDEVTAVLYHEMIKNGCEYFSLPLLIGSGPRSWGSYSTWAGRRIQRGDPILLETFGTVKRYSAALETSVILGQATREQTRGFEAVESGIQAAINAVKPGATAQDVDAALQGSFTQAGLKQYHPHRSGYSLGINFPPDPTERSLSLKPGERTALVPGMVFHLLSNLFIDGVGGLAATHTVLVTPDGREVLTKYRHRLTC